ncbi:MAG TPA: hypothetical protein VJT72_15190 [Pseudonocardiaceae bacterium]|nr:hypothetical protein [Pseudonocardiaceae bacterium]
MRHRAASGLVEFREPQPGFALAYPAGWERLTSPSALDRYGGAQRWRCSRGRIGAVVSPTGGA